MFAGVQHSDFTIFKGYTAFIITTKYWLYPLCCAIYLGSFLYISWFILLNPLLLMYLLCFFFVIFITLLSFLDSTCWLDHTVSVFLCLILLAYYPPSPSTLLQMAVSLFVCLWPSVCLLWKNVYSDPLPDFSIVFTVTF